MYDFPEIRDATNTFWELLATELKARGIADTPAHLSRPHDLPAFWSDQRLLLGQTCGYPYSIGLCGNAKLVATPVYNAPGCIGPCYGSVIIVPATSRIQSLEDSRGSVCAINMSDSNTGMNLLRSAIAAIGGKAPFFSAVIETLSHRNSFSMVAHGNAQIAAIDGVSFAHFSRIDPQSASEVRVIGETRKTPGLPFITSSETTAETLKLLIDAFGAVIHKRPSCLDILMLHDIVRLPPSAYDSILALERDAADNGYPYLI